MFRQRNSNVELQTSYITTSIVTQRRIHCLFTIFIFVFTYMEIVAAESIFAFQTVFSSLLRILQKYFLK